MKHLVWLFILISNVCLAADVTIDINPRNPVMGESFNVTFSILTESSEEPSISFNPLGAQVISKGSYGVSTSTTYINGKLSVEKKITAEYELMPQSSGEVFLRDIRIELGDKVYKHPTKRISIYKEPLQTADLFVRAEVSKNDVFVNESITVRYYIYSKYRLSSLDIKKFPQLDKFLKRYHDERQPLQRVEYDGELYNRKLVYTAQVFAQTAGTYKIDPITLLVSYNKTSNDPFGGIGFGFGQIRKKTILSDPVDIKVRALPIENVPTSFTGLVGKHQFSLKINKNKFLVNEPIEISFMVKGYGALETYEAPVLLSNANLEELVSDQDLKIDQNFEGTKTFDITYLGRGPVKELKRKIPFSYFDPETQKYVTIELDFNGLEVIGQALAKPKQNINPSASEVSSPQVQEVEKKPSFVLAPMYKLVNTYRYQSKNIVIFLLLILVIVLSVRLRGLWKNRSYKAPTAVQVIKGEGVTYSNLFSLLSLIRQKDDKDLSEIINNSHLSDRAKSYFSALMQECEKEFQSSSDNNQKAIDKKFLAEVEKIIKKNESIS